MGGASWDLVKRQDAEIERLRRELAAANRRTLLAEDAAYERAARCALAFGSPAVTMEVAARIRRLSSPPAPKTKKEGGT